MRGACKETEGRERGCTGAGAVKRDLEQPEEIRERKRVFVSKIADVHNF